MPTEIANALELHVAELVNAARLEAGLRPVHVELHLNSAAQGHSDWMSGGGGLSHQGAGGSTPADRAGDAEFPLQGGSWHLTENVAQKSISGAPGRGDVEDMHAALMQSSAHQANILDPDVDYLGVGLAIGQMPGGGGMQALYMTQNFASTSQPVLVQEEIDGQMVVTTYVDGEPVEGSSRPVEEEEEEEAPGDGSDEDEAPQQPATAGGSCFVATAAYGDPLHPDVAMLRRLRDEVLVHHPAGRAFIRAYWIIGPRLARLVDARRASGRASRLLLAPWVLGAARLVAGQERRRRVMLPTAWTSKAPSSDPEAPLPEVPPATRWEGLS